MSTVRPISFARVGIALAVFFAVCGMSIRMPLPLNAKGTAIRAKRVRRTESAAELAAKIALAEQSNGSSRVTRAARKEFAGPRRGAALVVLLGFASAYRSTTHSLTALSLDGAPRLLPLRC